MINLCKEQYLNQTTKEKQLETKIYRTLVELVRVSSGEMFQNGKTAQYISTF